MTIERAFLDTLEQLIARILTLYLRNFTRFPTRPANSEEYGLRDD